MISTKKLMEMSRKWLKAAEIGRKRILLQRAASSMNSNWSNISSPVANKGHFVVYTRDNQCFVIPLPYLNNDIFRELLKISEEFGLPRDGPITLPCDSLFLEYVGSFIRRGLAKNEEKAKLMSVISSCCSFSSSLHHGQRNQHVLVCN